MTFVHICVGFAICIGLFIIEAFVAWYMSWINSEDYCFGICIVWVLTTMVLAGFITYNLIASGII